jgi:crotonobetainyl-CoA:carnitine CoA-transferase CaiB-like acyl-CoA transferase
VSVSASSGGAALEGLKVVEIAQLIAGPMAGTLLADLGADVVHVEDPGRGDPQRATGIAHEGTYLWWKVSGRNKRSVTLDLRLAEGQELARELVRWADVVITNFRVGTLERWGLDYASLRAVSPRVIVLHINGFGTNTSLRNAPGFGKVGEAMSGVVQITGFPDGPPLHAGFSHADSLTGLMGAFAVQTALYRRANDPDFAGEYIDLALFETLYRLIEWQVITHDTTGMLPTRAGNQLPVSPAAVINTYLSADQQYITVTSGTPRSVQNVAALLGEQPSDYDTVDKQQQRRQRLDQLLGEWVSQRSAEAALARMAETEVVASRVFTMADIMTDPTYAERGDIIEVDDKDLGSVKMQAVIPHLTNHPGTIWRTGPALGADNDLVYLKYLGITPERYADLREKHVI